MIDAQLLTFMRESSRGNSGVFLKTDDDNEDQPANFKMAMSSDRIYSMNGYASHSSMSANVQLVNPQHSYSDSGSLQDALHLNGSYFHPMLPFGMANPNMIRTEVLEEAQRSDHYLFDTEGETCDSESEDDLMEDDECDELDECALGSEPDDPSILLNFVQTVTRDLHNMFARNKGSEDYCDIYEERFKTSLSGRELYYADLLALASNSEEQRGRRRSRLTKGKLAKTPSENFTPSPESNSIHSPTEVHGSEHTIIYNSTGEPQMCHLPHEGRCISAYGLGPLEELFRKSSATHCASSSSHMLTQLSSSNSYPEYGNFKNCNTYKSIDLYNVPTIPMTMRKLPNSFWVEPGHKTKTTLPAVNRTPDFSELFVQWGT